MRPAQSADRLGLGLAYRPWHHLRRVRTLLQSLRAELKIAPPPLVRRFAADAEVLAQLAHAFLFRRQRRHQPHLLVHRTDPPPRHRLPPPAVAFNLLPILPVYSVTYPAGLYLPNPLLGQGEGSEGIQRPLFFLLLEFQRGRVHAVAQSRRVGAVVEH